MPTITFDTHQFVRTLKDAGIPEVQAEAITMAFRTAHSEVEVATKFDIELVHKDIEQLRLVTQKDLAETKAELIRWVVGAGFLQTALISALLLRLIK